MNNEATFQIVEANQFRQYAHISLRMVQGNDETIKKFLAKKLKESKQQLDEIKLKYEHSEEQLHNHSNNNDRLLMELNTLKDEK